MVHTVGTERVVKSLVWPRRRLRGSPSPVGAKAMRPPGRTIPSSSPRSIRCSSCARSSDYACWKRERERESLRWEQFHALISTNAPLAEPGFAQALYYAIAGEREVGTAAVQFALRPEADLRQTAIVYDWCQDVMSDAEKKALAAKMVRALVAGASRRDGLRRATVARPRGRGAVRRNAAATGQGTRAAACKGRMALKLLAGTSWNGTTRIRFGNSSTRFATAPISTCANRRRSSSPNFPSSTCSATTHSRFRDPTDSTLSAPKPRRAIPTFTSLPSLAPPRWRWWPSIRTRPNRRFCRAGSCTTTSTRARSFALRVHMGEPVSAGPPAITFSGLPARRAASPAHPVILG